MTGTTPHQGFPLFAQPGGAYMGGGSAPSTTDRVKVIFRSISPQVSQTKII
jgi:hypothetical protein